MKNVIFTSPPNSLLKEEGKHFFSLLRMTMFLFLFCNCYSVSYSQDTIQFKNLDVLTSAEDNGHKHKIKSDPDNWDVHLFRTINNNRSSFKDAVIPVFDKSVLPMMVLMPVTTYLYGRTYDKTYDENTGYLTGGAEVTNFIFTFAVKTIVKRDRPYKSLANVHKGENYTKDSYSFPSAHTSSSFSIATMFALRYPKYPQVYAPMFAWALIVGYGRPYLGMHYPSDVLGGAIVGAGSSILIYSLRSSLFKLKNNVLNENKSDEGSIQGGTIAIFAGSFLVGSIFNQIFFKDDKIQFNVIPHSNGMGFNLNWKL